MIYVAPYSLWFEKTVKPETAICPAMTLTISEEKMHVFVVLDLRPPLVCGLGWDVAGAGIAFAPPHDSATTNKKFKFHKRHLTLALEWSM